MTIRRPAPPRRRAGRLGLPDAPAEDLASLEARLGHTFSQQALLEQALTHLSALPETEARTASNQRLEFLGDAVLGLAISTLLYRERPAASEGEMSNLRAALVRRETCAAVGAEWGLGPHLTLGLSELRSDGRAKPAILADACEAVLAAVYLDGGFEAASAVVERAWRTRLEAPATAARDAKTTLQEWAQARGRAVPLYREVGREGPDHAPVFTVAAEVTGLDPATGQGPSKRVAEQEAAKAFLQREGAPA